MSTERILVHCQIFQQFKFALVKAQDMIAPKCELALDFAMSAVAGKNRRLIAQVHLTGADGIVGDKPGRVNSGDDKHRLYPTILAAVDRTIT